MKSASVGIREIALVAMVGATSAAASYRIESLHSDQGDSVQYAHLPADHLAPYADRVEAVRAIECNRWARFGHSPKTEKACIAARP